MDWNWNSVLAPEDAAPVIRRLEAEINKCRRISRLRRQDFEDAAFWFHVQRDGLGREVVNEGARANMGPAWQGLEGPDKLELAGLEAALASVRRRVEAFEPRHQAARDLYASWRPTVVGRWQRSRGRLSGVAASDAPPEHVMAALEAFAEVVALNRALGAAGLRDYMAMWDRDGCGFEEGAAHEFFTDPRMKERLRTAPRPAVRRYEWTPLADVIYGKAAPAAEPAAVPA